MAKIEHSEKYGWWLNELESLGIRTKGRSDLKDRKGIRNLTENIKQTLYGEYKTVYSEV